MDAGGLAECELAVVLIIYVYIFCIDNGIGYVFVCIGFLIDLIGWLMICIIYI